VRGVELEENAIPFDSLKSLVEALNQLFNVLFSQENLLVRSLRVEVARQKTLNGKETILPSVTADLESDEPLKDYLDSTRRLVATIEEAGLKVSCHERRIQIEVSLKPVH
jgi:hypothetical protein